MVGSRGGSFFFFFLARFATFILHTRIVYSTLQIYLAVIFHRMSYRIQPTAFLKAPPILAHTRAIAISQHERKIEVRA